MHFPSVLLLTLHLTPLLALPSAPRADAILERDLSNVGPAPQRRGTKGQGKSQNARGRGRNGSGNGNGNGNDDDDDDDDNDNNPAVIVIGAPGNVTPSPVIGAPGNETPSPVIGAPGNATPSPVVEAPAEVVADPEAVAGEEEAAAGEVELAGVFGTPIALGGGDVKQDVIFTAGAIGQFEYEFQSATADELTVVENTTPAAPPAGFIAVEPNSFQVSLAASAGAGLTLSKIDYIFDVTNPAVAALDISQAQVGRLCTETGTFVIDPALGELEFEVEENEVTLNLNKEVTANGEWGIFLPVAAGAAPPAANVTAPVANVTEEAPGNGNVAAPVGQRERR